MSFIILIGNMNRVRSKRRSALTEFAEVRSIVLPKGGGALGVPGPVSLASRRVAHHHEICIVLLHVLRGEYTLVLPSNHGYLATTRYLATITLHALLMY